MATPIQQLEAATEKKYGLPEGTLGSIRQQETSGKQEYLDDPTKPHYPTGYTSSGVKSSAFGPYGILESTAAQPGYGTTPLSNKSIESQVEFAGQYLAGRSKSAGSLEAGLAGYGEGTKYANQVMNRIGANKTMATSPVPAQTGIDTLAASNIERNDATALALESFQAAQQEQYSQLGSMRAGQVEGVQAVKTTALMADAAAQANAAQAAADLGTDPNAANYALNKIAEQYTKNSARAQMFADRVANVADPANLLNDPLTYLRDALFFDLNQAGQRSAESAAQQSKDRFIGLNNMTQEVAQTQNAIKQGITTETAKIAGQMAADEIKFDVLKLNLDSIKTASDGIIKVAALRNDNMSIALRARDQVLQEQGLVDARQRSALQAQSLQAGLEERTERLNLKREQVQSQEEMLAAVNAGRQINGSLPPFRTFNEMQTAAKMNPKLQETISMQYQAGLTAQQTGVATIGATPYEALKYVSASGAKITDGRSKTLDFVGSIRSQVTSNPTVMAGIKKEADLAKAIDSSAQNAAATMSRNISSGSGNIYAAPPVSVFLEDAGFADTFMAKNVFAPAAQLGTESINFKSAVGMMVQAARDGKITMKQADSELGFLAEKIKGYNNSLYRYQATAGLPNMKSVNVALDDTSSFSNFIEGATRQSTTSPISGIVSGLLGGNTEVLVDLSDPNKRAAYLNKQMVKNIPSVLREQALINNSVKVRGQ